MAGDDNMSAQSPAEAEQKLAELLKTLTEHADEVQAMLQQLVELKRTGALDAVMIAVSRFEELIHYIFLDPAVFRLLSVAADGALGAMAKLEAPDVLNMKSSLQELIMHLGKNLTPDMLTGAKPVKGVWGLLTALSDPDVQRGLGVALALLKALGKQ